MSIAAPELRALTDTGLFAVYSADPDDEQAREAALREAARRDRLEAAAREREQVRAEWHHLAYADYLAAEAECRGELVNRAGVAAGVRDGFALWSGPRWLAEKYATEELLEFWLTHPRMTVTEYAARRAAEMRAARQEALFGDLADTAEDITTEEIAEFMEVTEDEHAEDLASCAAVDGPAPVRLRPGRAADSLRAGGAGGGDGPAQAGRVRDAGPVQPGPRMISFDQVAPQDTMLLSRRPFLPYGEVSLLYGSGSLGKGRMVQSIIAAVTNGEPVGLDESAEDDAGDVIVILPEDKQGESAVKRLIAAGANLSRCWDMTRTASGERFKLSASPRHPGHLPELRAAIEQLRAGGRNPRLLVIDPLGACIGEGTILTSKGARHLVESLQDLAEQTGLCVLVVAHPVSGGKLQGSWALQQALRSVFYVSLEEGNPDVRVLANVKGNDVPPELATDIKFTIVDGPRGPRAEWIKPQRRGSAGRQGQPNWRDDLAARRGARSGTQNRPVTYSAAVASRGRGKRSLGAGITSLEAAQRACEATPEWKVLGELGHVPQWVQVPSGSWVAGDPKATAFAVIATESASRAAV